MLMDSFFPVNANDQLDVKLNKPASKFTNV